MKLKQLLFAFLLCAPLTAAAQDIEINAENFPDVNFRNYLLQQSYGSDGILTEAEIKEITSIDVFNRSISSLKGIEYFTALTELQCPYNRLTSLDVSKNTALTILNCYSNQLVSLDVSGCKSLTSISCENNMIKGEAMDAFVNSLSERTTEGRASLYFYDDQRGAEGNVCTKSQVVVAKDKGWDLLYCSEVNESELTATWSFYSGSEDGPTPSDGVSGIAIDETNFPDRHFRTYLLLWKDPNYDGILTEAEIKDITKISVGRWGISSFQGIEYLTALTELWCSDNRLTSLDVSGCKSLVDISCYHNKIAGEAMDTFINSLPERKLGEEAEIFIYDNLTGEEGNVCTKSQVAAARAKGWILYYCSEITENGLMSLSPYLGSDDEVSSDIVIDEKNFPDVNFRNYLLRQSYGRDGILTEAEIKVTTELYLNGWNIKNLKGIEYFTALKELSCYNNQLTSLDVSGCKSLTSISCYHNMIKGEGMDAFISSLPESNPEEYSTIFIYDGLRGEESNVCTKTQVAAMEAKGWTPYYCSEVSEDGRTSWWSVYLGSEDEPSAPDGIAIDETNFPDEAFRNWLLEQDYGKDGVLTEEEIQGITEINFSNTWEERGNIWTLKGIEYFTALTYLDCSYNWLTSLDVSHFAALTYLNCSNNSLTSLDVSQNTALTYLDCESNQLTSLDVSQNTALTDLSCGGNSLTSLDVSQNTALQSLYCSSTQLASLDLSQNAALQSLNCWGNQLTTLDVSRNTALTWLYCGNYQLTSLDVSQNTALIYLQCYESQLTSLDVSGCTALQALFCPNNQLATLDVSKNAALYCLHCNNNQLASLDLSQNPALEILLCNDNQLTSLDVSQNSILYCLRGQSNQLTSIEGLQNTALTILDCYNNQIKGESMDALISSLPKDTEVIEFKMYYEGSDEEGNVCTKSQVAAAKAKGWIPIYTIDGSNWLEYEGVDDEVDGITLPGLENGSAPIYNMAGQKVTNPVKGGIYVVGGKKVVVK